MTHRPTPFPPCAPRWQPLLTQYSPFTFHGYGIQNDLKFDPRFCSDPAVATADPRIAEMELCVLIDEAHARGIYVIFDMRMEIPLLTKIGE